MWTRSSESTENAKRSIESWNGADATLRRLISATTTGDATPMRPITLGREATMPSDWAEAKERAEQIKNSATYVGDVDFLARDFLVLLEENKRLREQTERLGRMLNCDPSILEEVLELDVLNKIERIEAALEAAEEGLKYGEGGRVSSGCLRRIIKALRGGDDE
jgi:hypothetical protein